jgi:hypothetical protein
MADEQTEGSRSEQHPALAGDKAAEVAARTADVSKGTTFGKTFVIAGELSKDHPQHEHNCIRVLEEALQRGLHPKGEAKLHSSRRVDEDRRGVVSTAYTYGVEVEPAVTDTEAHKTVTPSSGLNKQATAAQSPSADR